ncbi:MAG: hypothetical protein KDB25_03290 [Leucobacter sp.]|nr:hypothetical protein [Leucobacter sp.]
MSPFRLTSRVIASPRPALAPVAHAVPWRVSARSEHGVIEVEHQGSEPLRGVRFALAGEGVLGLSLPRTVHPGERVRAVLRGAAVEGAVAAPDAMLVLRWFEPDGTELLWPIAL